MQFGHVAYLLLKTALLSYGLDAINFFPCACAVWWFLGNVSCCGWSAQSRFRTFPSTPKGPGLSCLTLGLALPEAALTHSGLPHWLWASGSSCFSCQWPQGAVSWDSFNPFPGPCLSAGFQVHFPSQARGLKAQFPDDSDIQASIFLHNVAFGSLIAHFHSGHVLSVVLCLRFPLYFHKSSICWKICYLPRI